VNSLAVIGILYASFQILRHVDLKRVIAYSSIAHMNFVVLGIFSLNFEGLLGAFLLMIGHAIISGGLFFLVGFLYDRQHNRLVEGTAGIVSVMPLFSLFFFLFCIANFGFPGTSNFIGEYLILVGALQQNPFFCFFGALGTIFSAAYSIWIFNRVVFGVLNIKYSSIFVDLSKREVSIITVLCFLGVILGLIPTLATAVGTEPLLRIIHILSNAC
jgi:NADH:ubiquinone oxidoreductase subunit 4 (subunit M)